VRFLLLYDDYYDFLGSQSKWERRRRKKEKKLFLEVEERKKKEKEKGGRNFRAVGPLTTFCVSVVLVILCDLLSSFLVNKERRGKRKRETRRKSSLSLSSSCFVVPFFSFSFFYLSLSVN
jgi:hypothetical protein